MPHEVGERVGAVLRVGAKAVEFLGYGTYVGDEIPETAVGSIAEGIAKVKRTNPKIELDSGEVVWGCECWWGREEAMKKQLEKWKASGLAIEEVSIDAVREEFKKSLVAGPIDEEGEPQ